jgi:hypothetical protein
MEMEKMNREEIASELQDFKGGDTDGTPLNP